MINLFKKPFWGKLFVVLAGVLAFLIVGEVGYRFYVHIFKPLHRPSNIEGLLWEPTPGAERIIDGVKYKINSHGFRGHEYAFEKAKDVFRIAVIGDSITWGYTELSETYPKVLERELKRNIKDKKVEVLNFGIQGVGLQNHLAILTERVLKYSPDLIIVGLCLNDLLNDRRQEQINSTFLWSMQHSHFLTFVTSRAITAARIVRAKTGLMTSDRYYQESAKLYEDAGMEMTLETTLQKMKLISKEKGAYFAVVLFPFSQQLEKGAKRGPQKTVAKVCKKQGIMFFDPLEVLRSYDLNFLYLEGDTVHFSAYGNGVVAESILNFVYLSGFLPNS